MRSCLTRWMPGSLLAAFVVVACGPAAEEAPFDAPRSQHSALTGNDLANIALANVGKGACSTNSAGGTAFDSSCTGNGGQPEYWCADYVRWVWEQGGMANTNELTAAAGSFYVYGQNHGTLHNSPSLGDAVVFNYQGNGVADHVAIVTVVNGDGTIETSSGDWNGQSGSEAYFSSTSHVVLNTPAYPGVVGSAPAVVGMTISGFISPVGVSDFPVGGAIGAEWNALGGAGSVLGQPTSNELPTADGVGRYQVFQNGNIYWSPATGAHEVHGAIRDHWAALGWENGPLGYPTTDEGPSADGTGRYNHFQHGSIYWSPAIGAWAVQDAISDKWAGLGWEMSFLGYPTTDETKTPDGIGRYNHFQHGSIYWSPATGAQSVDGAIRDKWSALGWEQSALGYPTTDEAKTPDGVGAFNHFEHGSIYWTAATGAHEVRGPIHDTWSALGWEQSALGYPTTDQSVAPDGAGAFNDFQNGSIYWSAASGAHEVRGAIRAHWLALGGVAAHGYPATNEVAAQSQGGAYNDFTHSDAIYLCPDAGPALVEGAVLSTWRAAGAEQSCLGFPRGDPASSGDQTFQGGSIVLSGGVAIATCSAPDGGSYLVGEADGGVPTTTGTTGSASTTTTGTSGTSGHGTATTGTTGTSGHGTSGSTTSTTGSTSGGSGHGSTSGSPKPVAPKISGTMGGCGAGIGFSPLALLAVGLLAWRRRGGSPSPLLRG